jgi:SpoVK/Ycf46/Vps4 family AAA+-type ATPase
MKAELIIKLVEAHSIGNERLFEGALLELANDEERKGNFSLATLLKRAYSSDRKPIASLSDSPLSSTMTFLPQSIPSIPKDKDSTLELVEIMQSNVGLSDVALSEKNFKALSQIIKEQKNAKELLVKGITPTNRVLFCGPPGCGKSLTANALAGELNIPIAYVKLDGLVSSYLGQTGANIRKIFEFVKNKRILLFLDEFDAIAKMRDDSHELGELKRVVTTLLQNLDAMPANVFLVAATNHHHLLDPAIWRRFDISILMELPDKVQRQQIINKFINDHLGGNFLNSNLLSVLTNGMSGAQVCSFMQSLVKHSIMNRTDIDNISIDEIADVWLQQSTLFISDDKKDYMKAISELHLNGVPIRTLEKITGIPKSTLNYRLKKEVNANE